MRKKKQQGSKIKLSGQELTYQIIINAIMVLVLLVCIVPLMYVVGMSLTSEGEMMARNYFVIIPRNPIIKAYTHIFEATNFGQGLKVTIARTIVGTATCLIIPTLMGYILAKEDFPFRGGILVYLIITMILGGGLIPNYMLMSKLKLLNTFWVYIIPGLGGAYNILIIKMFVEGLPGELIESADLDGASEMAKLWHICLPLMKPTICALGLFAAVGHWNDWFGAMVYVRNADLYPLQFMIRNLFQQSNQVDLMNGTMNLLTRTTPQAIKMASVVVGVLPILCVYPFLQKYFIYGMYTGSVKG